MGALITTRINDNLVETTINPDYVPADQAAAIARITARVILGTPVKARKCGRCRGTGQTVYTWNDGGVCRGCGGFGVVPSYTKAQKAALNRQAADVTAATQIFGDALRARHHEVRHIVRDAKMHLQETSPERYDRLIASVIGGRVEEVIDALVTYATDAEIYAYWAARREGK